MNDSRNAAFSALYKIIYGGAYSNIAVNNEIDKLKRKRLPQGLFTVCLSANLHLNI